MLTPSQIIPGSQLTSSFASYYLAQQQTIIQSMNLCNTTGAAVTCTVHIVQNNLTRSARTTIISARVIAAGSTYTCPESVGMIVEQAGTIEAIGNGVTIMASGVKVT